MADLPESTEWAAGIYQLETSDPVLGGPEGISNLQAKQLVSRTRWLKMKFDALIDGTVSAASAIKLAVARTISISGAATGSATFDGSANATITLTLTDSPALTGTPTAPTAASGNNTQQIANTEFVQATIYAVIAGAPGALDTLKELAEALGGDPDFANTIINALSTKADKANTLDGYGIANAFTRTESDTRYFLRSDYPGGIPKNTASMGESGWWRCADTGLVRQRVKILVGDVALGAQVTVVWPTQFPNQCSSIIATLEAASISSGAKFSVQFAIISKSRSGCVIALAEWVSEVQAADLTLNIQTEGH